MSAVIGVIQETAPGERRVALDPGGVSKLLQQGHSVVIQEHAGQAAGFSDRHPGWADADWVTQAVDVAKKADILVCVQAPPGDVLASLKPHAVVIGQLDPYQNLEALMAAADEPIALMSMELVPRITRAQAMDVLSSQATVAGYKAVILAAQLSPRLFPMLTTAAGTLRPAKVVIIGAGVAGLQAIATSRRLGAQVEAYDIRKAAREQVESLGAAMIDTGVDAETEGGYARALTEQEQQQQADALAEHLAKADVVIATASIPGKTAPTIITQAMVEGMASGSVIVDLAAQSGGNCELTQADQTITHQGVVVHGPINVPSMAPLHASEMYAKNIANLMGLILQEGEVVIDQDDEVIRGCLLSLDGRIVHDQFIQRSQEV